VRCGNPNGEMRAGPSSADTGIIERCRFLSALPRAGAKALYAVARSRNLRAREYGPRQGDPALGLAWLYSGLVYVHIETPDGAIRPHRLVWPGDISCYGIAQAKEYMASSQALIASRYFWVSQEDVAQAVRQVPELAWSLFCYASRQEERLAVWSTYLSTLSVRDRLRLVLARMALEMGRPREDGTLLDFAVTAGALAMTASASRDEVGRTLRQLVADGHVHRLPGRRLLVPEVARLLAPDLLDQAAGVGLALPAS
jgi:CRP-like cAMP-binding protein